MSHEARNFSENDPKILDLKSSSEQIIFRKLSLGAPVLLLHVKLDDCLLLMRKNTVFRHSIRTKVRKYLLGKDFLQKTLPVFWPVLALKVGKKTLETHVSENKAHKMSD